MHEIKCGEIWGGIHTNDFDLSTSGIEASLYSSACQSGKGGDIYYFSVCGGDKITRIAIADVTGHGEEVSGTSQSLYKNLKKRMNNVKSHVILSDMNKVALHHGFKAITTAAIATFSRNNSRLFFSYAGHHPILTRNPFSQQWSSLELPITEYAANAPLGVSGDLIYEQSSRKMEAGTLVFLYTDGVVEAKNAAGELFGESRLLRALELAPDNIKAIKNSVLLALQKHAGEIFDHDDVTFMAIRIREKPPSLLSKVRMLLTNKK